MAVWRGCGRATGTPPNDRAANRLCLRSTMRASTCPWPHVTTNCCPTARGCTNLIAPTARVDARYCSDACRVEAHRSRNSYKNDSQLPDTDPPGNVRASVRETQQNWGSKSDPQETERFPACIWREGAGWSQPLVA